MPKCAFCFNEFPKKEKCPYCGDALFSMSGAFITGREKNLREECSLVLTDRYIIVRKISASEQAGGAVAAQFGLVGALIGSAVDAARDKFYGFYDLREIQRAIFPYNTASYSKNTVVKFINKDGTEFAVDCHNSGTFASRKKVAKQFVENLMQVGIPVEDGSQFTYNLYCERPLVNDDTWYRRVCASAVSFVQLTSKQLLAAPIVPYANQNYYQPQTPAQQAVPIQQMPIQPQVQPNVPVRQVQSSGGFCMNCGSKLLPNSAFCAVCGTKVP